MLKKISILLVVTFMTLGSGCSTYNSIVPDWASIGSSSSEATTSEIEMIVVHGGILFLGFNII